MDPRTYQPADRFLYPVLALYLTSYAVWILRAASASSHSWRFMVEVLPAIAVVILVAVQMLHKDARFSALANVLALAAIGGAAFLSLMIVGAALAAV